tara:strand:- start:17458 stop:17703 length:246 start_codon:yes stop_codon:yes gene_type:complete
MESKILETDIAIYMICKEKLYFSLNWNLSLQLSLVFEFYCNKNSKIDTRECTEKTVKTGLSAFSGQLKTFYTLTFSRVKYK